MEIADIFKIFQENKCNKYSLSAAELVNIARFVNPNMLLDKSSQDIFYELDIAELSKSLMPQDEFMTLKKQGWAIKNDKLILYQ